MRTTVTLDPDVEAGLVKLARERGLSFAEALNSAVRAGLMATHRASPYRTPARSLGLRAGTDLDQALRLASDIEDAEIVQGLERGQ